MGTTQEPPTDLPRTLGALRASHYRFRSVKDEVRENLAAQLKEGKPLFPGIVGYDQTVIPQVVNAVLARHDIILLGLRGQAKTRILRQLVHFLDEWMPIVRGSEVNESPIAPFTAFGRRAATEAGDDLEVDWVHRSARYQEKLATPDVSIADLIGDIDPLKASQQNLTLSSEESILYGILPRTNRGIFAINELPDLQPRIQVGLLNILEESDIQIRGFPVRFPIDTMLVFSANPEDYTNRGNIITPLKDRIESQIITHYPKDIAQAVEITTNEAWTTRDGRKVTLPDFFREMVEEIAFQARGSEYVDQASGVSARMSISALECVVSNMERRALVNDEDPHPRVIDLQAALPAVTGKIELVYEGEQEGITRVARGLIGAAIKEVFVRRFPDAYAAGEPARRRGRGPTDEHEPMSEEALGDYKPILDWFAQGNSIEIDDLGPNAEYRANLDRIPGLAAVAREHGTPEHEDDLYLWMELILEGLSQRSLLAKEDVDNKILYLDMLGSMLEDLDGIR